MSTDILSSFTALQNELNQAKNSLRDYEENIKRLIGRDPSESTSRGIKRPVTTLQNDDAPFRGRNNYDNHNSTGGGRFPDNSSYSRQRNQFLSRNQNYDTEDLPSPKKRSMDSSVFKRLDRGKPSDDDFPNKPQMFSRVIVTPREVPSRQDALKAQDNDEKSKARNRRMFGALLGTLQKFRQEETKLKTKEDKRAQVEKKLEEQEVLERAKIKKERYELFLGRKKKQQEIRIIEQKMLRIKEHAFWEEQHKPLGNFIRTTAKPHIYYLPRRMNQKMKEKLDESKQYIEKLITEKKEQLQQELESIENRFKKDDHSKELEEGEIDDHDEIHEMLNEELEHPHTETKPKDAETDDAIQTTTEPPQSTEEGPKQETATTSEEKMEISENPDTVTVEEKSITENISEQVPEFRESDTNKPELDTEKQLETSNETETECNPESSEPNPNENTENI